MCEGQAWCSGESCLTESPGRGFEVASPQILRGEACLSFSLPQTPLMWEPPALGLSFFFVWKFSEFNVSRANQGYFSSVRRIFISISSFCFQISSNGLKHEVFDVSLADLENDEDQAHRKTNIFYRALLFLLASSGYLLVIPSV